MEKKMVLSWASFCVLNFIYGRKLFRVCTYLWKFNHVILDRLEGSSNQLSSLGHGKTTHGHGFRRVWLITISGETGGDRICLFKL
ncbi:hypothetical protein I7I50_05594 [Histoplasma capsulatum G186AR]|uniref:Uncharacterized protein n=1 Tax=Ajellomyces capsulatus TaxID=5037 RepID=A0A8H7ZAM5_AJECA|nr:hypothetical protein I7I52_03854 [Histoplasma capsulatum]QSS76219.1 hypothetical protein I7I50_05594 [Histoplasma capsulatum G186AR]